MKYKSHFICIFLMMLLSFSCSGELICETTGDVISIKKHTELETYVISIDGYRSRTWSHNNIIVVIKPLIKTPKAVFFARGTAPNHAMTITLIFQSKEDAQRIMGI